MKLFSEILLMIYFLNSYLLLVQQKKFQLKKSVKSSDASWILKRLFTLRLPVRKLCTEKMMPSAKKHPSIWELLKKRMREQMHTQEMTKNKKVPTSQLRPRLMIFLGRMEKTHKQKDHNQRWKKNEMILICILTRWEWSFFLTSIIRKG